MSSTVTDSRSRMRVSMSRRSPTDVAPSMTTVFSSSLVSWSSLSADREMKGRTRALLTTFISATTGIKIFCSGLRTNTAFSAQFSGRSAASVFGATSAKIKNTTVRIQGASSTPVSPINWNPITVATVAAEKLTKLLPTRITPSNRSGLRNMVSAFFAPLLPLLTKCRRRYRFRAIMAVSVPEK